MSKDTIINVCLGCIALCLAVSCWFLLEVACAIVNGIGNCVLF